MTKEESLNFLRQYQPLPSDDQLSEQLITKFDEVRKYFIEHPDPEAIPLFLNSFGEGSGFGVYQLVEDVINKFPIELVLPHLTYALQSSNASVRYWSAQIAEFFPCGEIVKPLEQILLNDDSDSRSAAITALSDIEDSRVDDILRQAKEKEGDTDNFIQLIETLEVRSKKIR
jgi:hypothetical protein